MLDLERIAEVAQEIARATFGAKWVEDVRVEPTSTWTGEDALQVMVVLHPSGARLLSKAGKASGMLGKLGDKLDRMGEPRFAFVSYATQEELDASDDPEC
ncbi:MAG: hypothetical protein EXR07_03470 [Acetobacteraceae bacterium]|nr:hypothetical protein [Acetobacteraceae bacterium]